MAEETGPKYIATKQIPKVEVPQNTLDAVLAEVRAMRVETADKFVEMSTRMSKMENRLDDEMTNRLSKIEVRLDHYEERGAKHSGGIVRESKVNEEQSAAIANIIERVTSIEEKTDAQTRILERLEAGAKELVKNPKVQLLAGILWTALLGYLASKGLVAK